MEEIEGGAIDYELERYNKTNEKLILNEKKEPKYLQLKAQDIIHHHPYNATIIDQSFKFTAQRVKINWLTLCGIDIKHLIGNTDIDCLDRIVSNVAYGDLEGEDASNLTHVNFLKIFRLAQLIIEYLLYVQNTLFDKCDQLKREKQQLIQHIRVCRLKIREQNAALKISRRDMKEFREQIQEITNVEKMSSEKIFSELCEKKNGVENQIIKLNEKIDNMCKMRDDMETKIINWNIPEAQKHIGDIAQIKLKEATEEILKLQEMKIENEYKISDLMTKVEVYKGESMKSKEKTMELIKEKEMILKEKIEESTFKENMNLEMSKIRGENEIQKLKLKENENEINEYQNKIKNLDMTMNKLKEEKIELNEKNEEILEKQNKEIEKKERIIIELKHKIRQMKNKENQYRKSISKYSVLTEQNNKKMDEINVLNDKLTTIMEENEILRGRNQKLSEENYMLKYPKWQPKIETRSSIRKNPQSAIEGDMSWLMPEQYNYNEEEIKIMKENEKINEIVEIRRKEIDMIDDIDQKEIRELFKIYPNIKSKYKRILEDENNIDMDNEELSEEVFQKALEMNQLNFTKTRLTNYEYLKLCKIQEQYINKKIKNSREEDNFKKLKSQIINYIGKLAKEKLVIPTQLKIKEIENNNINTENENEEGPLAKGLKNEITDARKSWRETAVINKGNIIRGRSMMIKAYVPSPKSSHYNTGPLTNGLRRSVSADSHHQLLKDNTSSVRFSIDDDVYNYNYGDNDDKLKINKLNEKSSVIQNSVGSRILSTSPKEKKKLNIIRKEEMMVDTSNELLERNDDKMRFSMRLAKKENSMDSFAFRTTGKDEESSSNITDNDTCSVLKED